MSYRRWVFIAIFLFGIGLVFGLVTQASIASLLAKDIAALEQLSSILVPFKFLTVILIFAKNALSLLLSFVFSPVFCLAPVLGLTINGWLLAFVSVTVVEEKSLGFVLTGLLPHGVFELPALILGQAAALSFGTVAMLALFKKKKRNLFLPSLKQNLRYLMLALVLLIPAAIIETYFTPLLLR
mgnify:CR=1 FL=1